MAHYSRQLRSEGTMTEVPTSASGWIRTTRNRPCPICGKTKWCGIAADGSAAICMVTESDKETANGGWLHRLAGGPPQVRQSSPLLPRPRQRDLEQLAERWRRNLSDHRLELFAESLGVTAGSLRDLGIGWTGRSWSFPMVDGQRVVVGLRYRDPRTGAKWAERGGREGVFLTAANRGGLLVVVEGPTDSAAALTLDLGVIGRPSCTGGIKIISRLTHGRDVVVIADADAAGRRGAEAMACALLPTVRALRVCEPPDGAKDLREAVRGGLDRGRLLTHIEAEPRRRLRLRVRR